MSKYSSKISCYGPDGNTMVILGKARAMMKMLKLPKTEIDALSKKVMLSSSYEEACNYIREYFPLDMDEE